MSGEKQFSIETQAEADDTRQVRIIYHKGRHHRTFHADGTWAALTPQMEVQFAFFNDLKPMPDEITQAISPEGGLGEILTQRQSPQTILRETNVTVVMNVEIVKNTISLLSHMVEQVEAIIQKAAEKAPAEKAPKSDAKVS